MPDLYIVYVSIFLGFTQISVTGLYYYLLTVIHEVMLHFSLLSPSLSRKYTFYIEHWYFVSLW